MQTKDSRHAGGRRRLVKLSAMLAGVSLAAMLAVQACNGTPQPPVDNTGGTTPTPTGGGDLLDTPAPGCPCGTPGRDRRLRLHCLDDGRPDDVPGRDSHVCGAGGTWGACVPQYTAFLHSIGSRCTARDAGSPPARRLRRRSSPRRRRRTAIRATRTARRSTRARPGSMAASDCCPPTAAAGRSRRRRRPQTGATASGTSATSRRATQDRRRSSSARSSTRPATTRSAARSSSSRTAGSSRRWGRASATTRAT